MRQIISIMFLLSGISFGISLFEDGWNVWFIGTAIYILAVAAEIKYKSK